MRHAKQSQRLSRPLTSRKSLFRHLLTGVVRHERITTTFARAKATQRLADRLITLGKDGSLSARRQVFDVLQDRTLTKRLFAEVAPLFQERQGGYTRVVRLNRRQGDGAELALLELVAHTTKIQPTAKPKKKSAAAAAPGEKPSAAPKAKEPETQATGTPSPATPSEAPAAETTKPAAQSKPKRFLQGLRDAWRRKKTDE